MKRLLQSHRQLLNSIIAGLICTVPSISMANWSVNIGYHNPPQAGVGVNFLHEWSQVALELGIGSVRTDANFDNDEVSRDDDGLGLGLGGDINGKYFFLKSAVRPYAQIGALVGTYGSIGDNSGVGLGAAGVFAGGGLWFGQTSSVHGYVSYNLISSSGFLQAGIGFDI